MPSAFELACELATRPGFDCLHDPNPATPVIEPYYDPVGYPTQGYGRLLSTVKWEPLSKYPAVSKQQAWVELEEDMAVAMRAVARLCPVPLSAEQTAALADFTFNAGGGRLQASTLRKRVLARDWKGAEREFGKWVYAGGRKLAGLIRRRSAEAALWRAGSY